VERFLHLPEVPVFCNVLLPTAEEAVAAPRGDLDLGICRSCGHVFNLAFDPELVRYAEGYENSLHHSPRFQSYAEDLADELRDRHRLTDAHVVEIACGQGDFLKLVCSEPGCTGTGFDPSFRGEVPGEGITIEPEYFGARPLGRAVDLICCRHALEHIDEPVKFMEMVKKAIPAGSSPAVFFEGFHLRTRQLLLRTQPERLFQRGRLQCPAHLGNLRRTVPVYRGGPRRRGLHHPGSGCRTGNGGTCRPGRGFG